MAQPPESSGEGDRLAFEQTPGVDLRGEVLSLLAGLSASCEVSEVGHLLSVDRGTVYVTGVVYVTTGNGERWVCGLPRRLGHGHGHGSRPSGQ